MFGCHDMKATEMDVWCRDLGLWVATGSGWWGSVATECTPSALRQHAIASTTARAVCVHCAHDLPTTVYSVVHCLEYYS